MNRSIQYQRMIFGLNKFDYNGSVESDSHPQKTTGGNMTNLQQPVRVDFCWVIPRAITLFQASRDELADHVDGKQIGKL